MDKKITLTCPNEACGKVFIKPLTTLNLQKSSKEPYNACPYCLEEITSIIPESNSPSEKENNEIANFEEKIDHNIEESLNCKHYFGYMKEKEHKQEMPEECMLCPKIVECMK